MPRQYERTETILQTHLDMANKESQGDKVIITVEDLYGLISLAAKAPVHEVKNYIANNNPTLVNVYFKEDD